MTKKILLFDTNILQHLNKEKGDLAIQVLNYINQLTAQNYKSAISDFSIFELLDGCPTLKLEKQLISTLDSFERYELSEEVFLIAAWISTLYRTEKAEYAHIEDGDKLIAATSFLIQGSILTANSRDYPRPFFLEDTMNHIFYSEGHNKNVLSVFVLKPNIDLITFKLSRRK